MFVTKIALFFIYQHSTQKIWKKFLHLSQVFNSKNCSVIFTTIKPYLLLLAGILHISTKNGKELINKLDKLQAFVVVRPPCNYSNFLLTLQNFYQFLDSGLAISKWEYYCDSLILDQKNKIINDKLTYVILFNDVCHSKWFTLEPHLHSQTCSHSYTDTQIIGQLGAKCLATGGNWNQTYNPPIISQPLYLASHMGR